MHYYGSLPEPDLQWLREGSDKSKKNQRKTVEIEHKKYTELRTDIFILNASILY